MKTNKSAPVAGSMLILVVDDRPENCLALEDMLAAPGRRFIHAYNGNDALRLVLKHRDIGLVLLDVQMPDMDGFEVARLLKSNPGTRDISIIFVTALSKEQHYIIRGFEEGAVDYLQKPLDLEVTQAKVRVFEKLYHYQLMLKLALEETKQVNQQLERFTHTVAHDIKSPLAGMVTLLSVLSENAHINSNQRTADYINVLSEAASHMTSMVSSVLDYSRQSHAQQATELVNTGEMVNAIFRRLIPPESIALEAEQGMPVLHTRRQKLEQVFQNLLSNAIKFCDKGKGKILVGCEDKPGAYFRFFVSDNGPGIPEHEQPQLFNLFQKGRAQSTTADSSTGVGLNILKVLVEEQGGRIQVQSKPGAGTTISFDWRKEEA